MSYHIKYKNDCKLKDDSWEATLEYDGVKSLNLYMGHGCFSDATGYGPTKGDAHNALMLIIQQLLAEAHEFLMTLEPMPKETRKEHNERWQQRYGGW